MDDYERCRVLGTGTFGSVWLIRSKPDAAEYVSKEIPLSAMILTKDRSFVAVVNEFKILGTLRHKNIVSYKDAFVEDMKLCIIMEYADDGDLSTKIKQQCGRLFLELYIIDWFVQILVAVKYIHSLNILHRDIKARNIFLTRSGLIKVGDFGISCFDVNSVDERRSVGTTYYMAPEVCEGMMYTQKSDMWSLGVLLYQLCSLEYPFVAEDFSRLQSKITFGHYAPISHCYSSLLKDLVCVLLRVEAEKRPSSAQLLKAPSLHAHLKSYLMKVKDGPVLFKCQMEKDDTPTSIGVSSKSISGQENGTLDSIDSLDSSDESADTQVRCEKISKENDVDEYREKINNKKQSGSKIEGANKAGKKINSIYDNTNQDHSSKRERGKNSNLDTVSKSLQKSPGSGSRNGSGDNLNHKGKSCPTTPKTNTPKRSNPMKIDFIKRNKILATSPPERFINSKLSSPNRPNRDELFSPLKVITRQAKSAPEVTKTQRNVDEPAPENSTHLRSKSSGTKGLLRIKTPLTETKIPSLSGQVKQRSIPRPVNGLLSDRSRLINETDTVSGGGKPKSSKRYSSDKFSFYNLRKRARSPAIGSNTIEKKIARVSQEGCPKKKPKPMVLQDINTPRRSQKKQSIMKMFQDSSVKKAEKKPMVICNELIVLESESDVITNHEAVKSSENKENETPSMTHNRTFTLSPEEDDSPEDRSRLSKHREAEQQKQEGGCTSTPLQSSGNTRFLQPPLHSTLKGNFSAVSLRAAGITPRSQTARKNLSTNSTNCTCHYLNYDTTCSRDISVLRSKIEGRLGTELLDTAVEYLRRVDLSDEDFANMWKLCQLLKLEECLFFNVLEIVQAEK